MPFAKIVRQLILFELKHSIGYLLLLIGLSLSLLFIHVTMSELDVMTVDELIILGFPSFTTMVILIVLMMVARPKVFRTQNLMYNFRVCEHLVHLLQLPLKKSMIVTYRLMVNYILLIPILTIHLTTLYIVISPLRELLPLGNFIVFACLWFMIGIVLLNTQVLLDFGTNILFSYVYLFTIFLPLIIATIVIFNIVTEKNLFELMVYLTTNFPLQSFIASMILIILSILISYRWSRKRMSKIDYFL